MTTKCNTEGGDLVRERAQASQTTSVARPRRYLRKVLAQKHQLLDGETLSAGTAVSTTMIIECLEAEHLQHAVAGRASAELRSREDEAFAFFEKLARAGGIEREFARVAAERLQISGRQARTYLRRWSERRRK